MVDHDFLAEAAQRLFGASTPSERRPAIAAPGPVRSGRERLVRDSAQSHLVFGTDLVPHSDSRRYPLVLLSNALGGGMSSRLFQRIREELALAYAVYSFQSFYSSAGQGGVYVGTRPGGEERVVEAVLGEYAVLAREGLPAEELEQAKRQVKGQIMLALESTGSRLHRLAGFALYDEPYLTLDELLARIDAVSEEELAAVAAEFFDPERQFVVSLGPEA
jgi:predicted Zn-dependent peptidase